METNLLPKATRFVRRPRRQRVKSRNATALTGGHWSREGRSEKTNIHYVTNESIQPTPICMLLANRPMSESETHNCECARKTRAIIAGMNEIAVHVVCGDWNNVVCVLHGLEGFLGLVSAHRPIFDGECLCYMKDQARL